MDFGLVLPTMGPVATPEAIEAAADLAVELGWSTLWTTDHVLVPSGPEADEYGHIFEALTTLAYVAGRTPSVRIGTSTLIVGMRQATLLAKELATLDVLSRGRLIAGIAIGDQPGEFANLERGDLYRRRAAYLEEAVSLWRHLWSGSIAPFTGRFHTLESYAFSPLPVQKASLPIWIGGSSEGAIRRAGRVGDGYHATRASPRVIAGAIDLLRGESAAAERPMPTISDRLRVRFGATPSEALYALTGSGRDMVKEIEQLAACGVAHVALVFEDQNIRDLSASARRFDREVVRARS
jgi:probable F420-dependent oxidoreductase